jgi:hypothetical protein
LSKAEEACTGILKIFGELPELYDFNYDMVGQCDNEIVDLLHEIELAKDKDIQDGYKLYRELREVQRVRRQAKDENELLQPLVDALKQQETFRLKLYKVHDKIKGLAREQGERIYKPRVREDLTIAGDEGRSDVG